MLLKWSHQCHGLTCRQLGTKISYQILHRIAGLMLCFKLLKTAFLGNTGEGKEKILREKLSPFLSFLTEQGRNWAIRFWEPLFPVPRATFWTWTWIKFHSWLLFPEHLGTIWGQDNGIHHSFLSTAAPWTCCDLLPYKGLWFRNNAALNGGNYGKKSFKTCNLI